MSYNELVALWKIEVLDHPNRPATLRRLLRRLREKELAHYLFWFRLGQYFLRKPSGLIKYKKIAQRIHARLIRVHGMDIGMAAEIGAGFHIGHRVGVVITGKAKIGKNFHIRQNTTIGLQHPEREGCITIGDNVEIGANSCILGNSLRIGKGVVIGAMSFVNRDIPDGATFYTTHTPNIRTSCEAPHERPLVSA
jgi:serine acetyltransferase